MLHPPLTPPPLGLPVQEQPQNLPGAQAPRRSAAITTTTAAAVVPVAVAVPLPVHEPHHHRLAPVARVRVRHVPLGIAPPLPLDEPQDPVAVVVILAVAPPPPPAAVAVTVPPPPTPAIIIVQVVVRVRLLHVIGIGVGGDGQDSGGGQGVGLGYCRGRTALLDLLDGTAWADGVQVVVGVPVGSTVTPGRIMGAVWAYGPARDGACALFWDGFSVSKVSTRTPMGEVRGLLGERQETVPRDLPLDPSTHPRGAPSASSPSHSRRRSSRCHHRIAATAAALAGPRSATAQIAGVCTAAATGRADGDDDDDACGRGRGHTPSALARRPGSETCGSHTCEAAAAAAGSASVAVGPPPPRPRAPGPLAPTQGYLQLRLQCSRAGSPGMRPRRAAASTTSSGAGGRRRGSTCCRRCRRSSRSGRTRSPCRSPSSRSGGACGAWAVGRPHRRRAGLLLTVPCEDLPATL